jgi:hypothetical protein
MWRDTFPRSGWTKATKAIKGLQAFTQESPISIPQFRGIAQTEAERQKSERVAPVVGEQGKG